MNIGIISDIHGNNEALEAVLEKLDHTDFIICAGDIVGHVPKIGNAIYINPGSVGEPRDGNADASYAILDTQTMEAKIERIAYDVNAVADRIMKHKLPEEIASIFRTGKVPWEDV
ncbi:MAG: metallophosphatase family protein [Euryarchaeota archaeon]|nr:metallophosphatase family protein [Euryarchaeota archaeon]MCG2737354.1 metallophosphatase family protein [Candidatus Methanoperedenaceae archaeon]